MRDNEKVQKIIDDVTQKGNKVITEEDAKSILSVYEISVPAYSIVTSESEAESKAKGNWFSTCCKNSIRSNIT
jgi:3-hydroxypropionyl-CoA synthetase (ADP-forming)